MKSYGLFSIEADLVVMEATNWLQDRAYYRIPAIAPYIAPAGKRRFSEQDKADMRRMARESGWAEFGGKAAGGNETLGHSVGGHWLTPSGKSQRELNEDGQGRTKWIGQPEWARGFGMSPEEIGHAVEKAIAGERLGSKQREVLQSMIDALYEQRAEG